MATNSLFASAFCLICAASAAAGPVIKWDSTRHDFGAFNEDLSTVTCTFKGINTGDEPLVIYDVKPNCGCTTTERYAGQEYAPGDSIFIRTTYNAVGRPGRFSKRVMIHSNASPSKQFLTISGTVIGTANTLKGRYPVDLGQVRLSTSTAMMGEVKKGGVASTYFKGYNPGPATVVPEVIDAPSYMKIAVKPESAAAGEQFIISVNAFTADCPQWGLVTDSITVRPDAKSDTTIVLTTVMTVKEDFSQLSPAQLAKAPRISVKPTLIDLGRISSSDTALKRTITITNDGTESQLLLRRVYSPDPAISVGRHDTRIAKGKSTEINITINPSLSNTPGMVNARITIISNDPAHPVTIVRVVGELTD